MFQADRTPTSGYNLNVLTMRNPSLQFIGVLCQHIHFPLHPDFIRPPSRADVCANVLAVPKPPLFCFQDVSSKFKSIQASAGGVGA